MHAALRRVPARPARRGPQKMDSQSFPAPVRGWIADENLARSKPGGAYRLDNWFPTQTSIRLRGGCRKHATIGTDPVETLFTYRSGGLQQFFAADEENIFPISSPADPDVAPTADITGQTSGYYSTPMFSTAAGDFMYALNGTDNPQLYDGTTWAEITAVSTPIAITGVTPSTLSQGWAYRNRLFFVERGTMRVWYPSVNLLGGALSSLTMAGVFKKGGAVLFGSSWSLDAGDGVDDKCVIVSTEGEAAVFEGANPSDTNDWRLVGVYNISRPLGKNAWLQVGGDLIILTEEGIVPISMAIGKDPAALSLAAISRNIEPEWKRAVQDRRTMPWEVLKWPEFNMGIVNVPIFSATDDPISFVVNLETGAWCRYTGWDTRCLGLYQESAFFGTNDGTIMQAEVGGNDDGSPYECVYVGLFDDFKETGITKIVHQGRGDFISSSAFNPLMSVSVDYGVQLLTSPNSVANYAEDVWDQGLWDVALWDSTANPQASSQWFSIGRSGFAIAPQIQVVCSIDPYPRVELIATHLTFEKGGLVV